MRIILKFRTTDANSCFTFHISLCIHALCCCFILFVFLTFSASFNFFLFVFRLKYSCCFPFPWTQIVVFTFLLLFYIRFLLLWVFCCHFLICRSSPLPFCSRLFCSVSPIGFVILFCLSVNIFLFKFVVVFAFISLSHLSLLDFCVRLICICCRSLSLETTIFMGCQQIL